eukprot:2827542-Pleurochrysis_carterae.AAC.1
MTQDSLPLYKHWTWIHNSMRTVPPPLTEHATLEHDSAVDACLSDVIACPDAPATSMLTALHQACRLGSSSPWRFWLLLSL